MRVHHLLLPLVLVVSVLIYLPGLPGPFLFDDTAHVAGNTQVHINYLNIDSLKQAWHSSHLSGTGSRPLAQLSFGINHALTGLDTWYFKATNLGVHLLAGLLIFALTRQLTRALSLRANGIVDSPWPALLTAGLWLLHPINLTPVLYIVQRMTGLSALFVLAGLWCHVSGRLRMADGDRRGLYLALTGLPIALIGVLAKEIAAVYPILVLVLEWTLLRELKASRRGLLTVLTGVLPLLIGITYLLTHPGYLDYSQRDFTLPERLLTEARVLWLYLQMLAIPDLSVLGFYHDDVVISRALWEPWTTPVAALAWLVLVPTSVLLARRWPVVCFAVLFYLAGHALESTIFPLELVFEHRNYLPSLGPLFAAAWLLAYPYPARIRRLAALLAALLLVALAILTNLRANDWRDEFNLVFAEVRHHPDSPRANFRTAQLLMDQVSRTPDNTKLYEAARHHLERVRQLSPADLNAQFGLIYLELFVDRDPDPQLLGELVDQLRNGVVDPTHLSVSQFSFLVRWQQSPNTHKLSEQQALSILLAPLDNPRMNSQGHATALSAVRAYYDLVLDMPEKALPHAKQAVQTWPARWHYHYRLVQLLMRLGMWQEAQAAYTRALQQPSADLNPEQRAELAEALQQHARISNNTHD